MSTPLLPMKESACPQNIGGLWLVIRNNSSDSLKNAVSLLSIFDSNIL